MAPQSPTSRSLTHIPLSPRWVPLISALPLVPLIAAASFPQVLRFGSIPAFFSAVICVLALHTSRKYDKLGKQVVEYRRTMVLLGDVVVGLALLAFFIMMMVWHWASFASWMIFVNSMIHLFFAGAAYGDVFRGRKGSADEALQGDAPPQGYADEGA